MPLSRAKLDEMLDGLEAALPKMMLDYPEDDLFWPYFSGHAGVIESGAAEEDGAHVRARLSRMLQAIGKVKAADAGRSGAGHG